MTPTWPALIGAHLYESRRKRWPFSRAWDVALDAHPKPKGDTGFNSQSAVGWAPGTVESMRAAFENAYYRRARLGPAAGDAAELRAGASLITDPVRLFTDPYVAPVFEGARLCGWGGRDGCPERARDGGWLCEAHKTRVRVAAVEPLCLHPDCLSSNHSPNEAHVVNGEVDDYCKRHRVEIEALTAVAA